jgi:hypothetical protein
MSTTMRDLPGPFEFSCSNRELSEGVAWAKKMALSYVRDQGDKVGPWIESALPGRDAFCMRDVSHMSAGAHVLGLERFIYNMMHKFTASIAESRDWTAFWEINKDDEPAPVDYTDDDDFWFNLPANFDVLQCCWKAYQLSNNEMYVKFPTFRWFYDRTINEFVETWDRNGDGLVEGPMGIVDIARRGIPSYEEATSGFIGAFDLLVWQHDAFLDYADMMDYLEEPEKAVSVRKSAAQLRTDYETRWWDSDSNFFFEVIMADGQATHAPIKMARRFPRGYVPTEEMVRKALSWPDACVEARSYYPEECFRYDLCDVGVKRLCELVDPTESRRGYPEVSYAVVGSTAEGLMGLAIRSELNHIRTLSRLGSSIKWAEADGVAVPEGTINIRHEGTQRTVFVNHSDRVWEWQPSFYGSHEVICVDSSPSKHAPNRWVTEGGKVVTSTLVQVKPGESVEAVI